MNHHKHDYDGGVPNIPEGVGDRYYTQDLGRDFWYLLNESSLNFSELFESFPVLLKDSNVVQGSSLHEIDIPIVSGIVEYEVNVPNSFASIPPSVTTANILVYLLTTAQTDFDIQGTATLDGVTTNYLKVTYTESDEKSRSRAKKAGSYSYEVTRSFSITCDTVAPTDADLVLAEIVGDDATFLTISNKYKTDFSLPVDVLTADIDYAEITISRKIIVNVTAGDIILGLFNGASDNGKKISILAIGSTNQCSVELASAGVTDYTLNPGESLDLIWDDVGSGWVVKSSNFLGNNFSSESGDVVVNPSGVLTLETNNQEIELPDISKEGTSLEVFSKEFSKILQGDAENVISWKNKFFTTKGTSGYLQLKNKDRVRLAYRGIDSIPVEPGVKLSDPSTLPTGQSQGNAFSFDGIYLAVAHSTSPFVTIYKRSGDTFTKLANPASLPAGTGLGCAFSPDGVYLAVSHQVSPYVTIYKRSGDTFTKLANPASLPAGNGNRCEFSFDGNYLAVAHDSSPYITIYSRSGDTFTKLANPANLPAGNASDCSFSYDGNYLAVSHSGSPYITIYSRSEDTFTKLANPSSLPPGGTGCNFSYDGVYLAVSHTGSPYITIYKRSGSVFTKLGNPGTLPGGASLGCRFSYNGNYLAVGHGTSPYITIYKCTRDTCIKISDPSSLPAGNAFIGSFSYDGNYLVVSHTGSPYITIYKNVEDADKVWEAIEIDTLYEAEKKYMFF